MIIPIDKLKKLVLKSGLVDPIELEQAEKSSIDLNKPLEDVLIERGVILEKFLGQTIAAEIGYPYADLRDHKIKKELLELLREDAATKREEGRFETEGSMRTTACETSK